MSETKKLEQNLTWGDVYWNWKKRGFPAEEAAFQADEFMRRRYREREANLQRAARKMKK